MNGKSNKTLLCGLALSVTMLFAPIAFAGPPLLCHPFDIGNAHTLAWGGPGWNQPRSDYDLTRLSSETEALLTPQMPVIVRMETLRRAAIYASHNGAVARDLNTRLAARADKASTPTTKALALFDAGYFTETLQEIVRLQGYEMPGVGKVNTAALRAIVAAGDGSVRIDQALALRPNDAAMRFAAALVASADQRKADAATHKRIARLGAGNDRLLARNLSQIAN